ncbi:hypothetical protein ACQEVF_58605 [Nonomuraea polychroma]|uniref:hypothetical protein n=1 Tax=Nonomuraea polychroma TaxID=46176 RepID=UPI003D8C930E
MLERRRDVPAGPGAEGVHVVSNDLLGVQDGETPPGRRPRGLVTAEQIVELRAGEQDAAGAAAAG